MQSSLALSPLNAESSRQAVHALRGFDYQIWRTVLRWLMLKDDEHLYLENAEDFEVLSPDGRAESVQIKASTAPVTLGEEQARRSIAHFLKLKVGNPGLRVHFQFLTRGVAGHERGRPFGDNTGIHTWDAVAKGSAQALSLFRYLEQQLSADPSALAELQRIGSHGLKCEVCECFEWVMQEPDFDIVQQRIERLLGAHAQRQGISVQIGVGILDHLLERARQTARQTSAIDRALTRTDFLLIFETKTSLPVPPTAELLRALAATFSNTQGSQPISQPTVQRLWASVPPPLGQGVFPRHPLMEQVNTAVASGHPVLITGLAGSGKTTLAQLATVDRTCFWVDLAGVHSHQLADILWSLSEALTQNTRDQAGIVVLDDIEASENLSQAAWRDLRVLHDTLKRQGHGLLMTSQGVPQNRIDVRLQSWPAEIIEVTSFTEEETKEVLVGLGCPSQLLDKWATACFLQTGGHPKLVHVHGLNLQQCQWPLPTASDFSIPPAAVAGQKRIERLSLAKMLSAAELEYLYALSIVMVPIERDMALHIGSTVEGLEHPGDVFDRMTGRWVEARKQGTFRLTSLLAGAANEAWPEERRQVAHATAFDAILAKNGIRIDQALGTFFHGLLSADGVRLGSFLAAALCADAKTSEQLCKFLLPIVHIGLDDGKEAFPGHEATNSMLRQLQLKIAEREDPDLAPQVAVAWGKEISQSSDSTFRARTELMMAVSILLTQNAPFTATELVQALQILDRQGHLLPQFSSWPDDTRALVQNPANTDPVVLFFSLLQLRRINIAFLDEFLTALGNLPTDLRDRLLSAFDFPVTTANSAMIEMAWVSELRQPQPDWPRVAAVLTRAWSLATGEWASRGFAVEAAQALSIVLDEHLDDRLEANRVISVALQRFPGEVCLEEREATMAFLHGELDTAIRIWHTCLAGEQRVDGIQDSYIFRRAGIAASQVQQHVLAAAWFARGAKFAATRKLPRIAGSLYFDAALAAFHGGDGKQLTAHLAEGLKYLRGSPNPESELRDFAFHKHSGHVVLWILAQLDDMPYDLLHEPHPGCCSNPDVDKKLAELPPSNLSVTQTLALIIFRRLGVDTPPMLDRARLQGEPYPYIGMQLIYTDIWAQAATAEFSDLPMSLDRLSLLMKISTIRQQDGIAPWEPWSGNTPDQTLESWLGCTLMWKTAMAVVMFAERDPKSLIEQWCSGASPEAQTKLQEALSFLAECRSSLLLALERMESANLSVGDRSLAAATVLTHPQTASIQHLAFAAIAFLHWGQIADARIILEHALQWFNAMLTKHLERFEKSPALIRTPRLTLPILRTAVQLEDVPAARTLKLILAIEMAAGVKIPNPLKDWLETLAARDRTRHQLIDRAP